MFGSNLVTWQTEPFTLFGQKAQLCPETRFGLKPITAHCSLNM